MHFITIKKLQRGHKKGIPVLSALKSDIKNEFKTYGKFCAD